MKRGIIAQLYRGRAAMATFEMNEAGLSELFHDPDGPVAAIMERAAYTVENAAKRNLLNVGSGGMYLPGVKFFRRGPKLYRWERFSAHQASAPGEPASSDSGQLMASVGHTMFDGEDGISSEIGSDNGHAGFTEYGTRYMEPRPWLRPALTEVAATEGWELAP